MAVIKPVIVPVGNADGSMVRVTWTPVTNADTCDAVAVAQFADKSVQALGTFDSGSVALHGSNDGGATFAALNDPGGTVIAISAAGIKAVLENTELVKPVIAGGAGSQSITVAMVARLANPLRT